MKINGTWYNVEQISQMTFEEFCSIFTANTKEQNENLYFQITGKKPEIKTEKKETKPVKKKEIDTENIEEVKE